MPQGADLENDKLADWKFLHKMTTVRKYLLRKARNNAKDTKNRVTVQVDIGRFRHSRESGNPDLFSPWKNLDAR